ncbi:MAG: hypothetical protein E7166_00210 [Firmicutes bacterium]|nr:hypothetical protein [Bacillota bacterium]
MIKVYLNELLEFFDVVPNQLTVTAIKALISAMEDEKLICREKQKIVMDEKQFYMIWNIYYGSLNYFDPNYNRKTDFKLFFKYIIQAHIRNDKINFLALFCPGYTRHGYKNILGSTTKWKLK